MPLSGSRLIARLATHAYGGPVDDDAVLVQVMLQLLGGARSVIWTGALSVFIGALQGAF